MRRRSDASVLTAVKLLPFFLLPALFSCEKRETVTVPRMVFAICPQTPCRVPVGAVRGSVLAGERRPHNFLIDVRDFAARHPDLSPFRFAPDERRRASPGRLEVWMQAGERPRRVTLEADTTVTLEWLRFPQAPAPGTTAVWRPVRPAPRAFRCQDHADAGTWFAVPWTPATAPLPPIRKPSIQLATSPVWAPLTVFVPQGRHFVFARFPGGRADLWMALFSCLGPVSLASAEPGRIATAQAAGVSLWQWAAPVSQRWGLLAAALALDKASPDLVGSGPEPAVIVAAVRGQEHHVERVDSPVDFLVKMLAAGALDREEAWAAWNRLLLAGNPPNEFERLREALTALPE